MVVEVVRDVRMVVRVVGEIDLSNVAELDTALRGASEESPEGFVVDVSEVSCIDSMGIRAILLAWRRLRDVGGSLALVQNGTVGKLFEIVGFRSLPCLLICESVVVALSALSSSEGD